LEFRDLSGEDQKDQKPVGECPNTRFVAATAVQDHTRENDRPLLFSVLNTGSRSTIGTLKLVFGTHPEKSSVSEGVKGRG